MARSRGRLGGDQKSVREQRISPIACPASPCLNPSAAFCFLFSFLCFLFRVCTSPATASALQGITNIKWLKVEYCWSSKSIFALWWARAKVNRNPELLFGTGNWRVRIPLKLENTLKFRTLLEKKSSPSVDYKLPVVLLHKSQVYCSVLTSSVHLLSFLLCNT